MIVESVALVLASILFIFWVNQSFASIGVHFWRIQQYKTTVVYPAAFPPGPRFALPLVGEAWALGVDDVADAIASLAKKYGPAVGLYCFSEPVVVFNSADLIFEAMDKEELAYRPEFPTIKSVQGLTRGLESKLGSSMNILSSAEATFQV